jgi:diguanylate cyclase (GGDEF)-like protein/PAS domain S-box-containing protein
MTYQEELQERIEERTAELTQLNKTLFDINKKQKQYVDLIDKHIITATTDKNGFFIEVSEAFCRVSGYTKDELIGKPHSIIRHFNTDKSVFENMWQVIKSGRSWKGILQNLNKSGKSYWLEGVVHPNFDDGGKIVSYTEIKHNITDKKKLEELSILDPLTGLYNRRHFNSIIKKELLRARRDGKTLSFAMMDIDHFKLYNDTYGHKAGDEVLISVSSTIKSKAHRSSDFVFRMGGEEFGVLFSGLTQEQSFEFIDSIREEVEKLEILHKKSTTNRYVTISIGVVTYSGDNIPEDVERLYREADGFLYNSKESGRNRVSTNFNI